MNTPARLSCVHASTVWKAQQEKIWSFSSFRDCFVLRYRGCFGEWLWVVPDHIQGQHRKGGAVNSAEK